MKQMIVLSCLLTGSLFSQERSLSGGFGVFMFGGAAQSIKSLNSALSSAGYQKFADQTITIGGGGYAVTNNLIYGGEGHALTAQNKLSDDRLYETRLSGRYGIFRVGYVVYSGKAWLIYPMAGFGKGSFDLRMTNVKNATPDPAREAKVHSNGYLLDLGIGASFTLNSSGKRSFGGLITGIAAGFTWMPSKNTWTGASGNFDTGSHAAFTGPYVRLMFGGAGFRSNQKQSQ